MSDEFPCAPERASSRKTTPCTRLGGVFLKFRAYLHDRDGIGGIEFAIIAPILIAAYLTCFELTVGFSFAKRATRAAGTVGDLVAQQSSTVNKAFLTTMTNAAKSVFAPYDVDGLTTKANNKLNIKITGVKIDASSTAKVLWSWQRTGNAPYVIGTSVSVPTEMRIANSFLIRTELTASYPLLLFLPTNLSADSRSITMNREIFYQQRTGDEIACSDC